MTVLRRRETCWQNEFWLLGSISIHLMKENLLAWEETTNAKKDDNRRRDKSSWVSSSANEKEHG